MTVEADGSANHLRTGSKEEGRTFDSWNPPLQILKVFESQKLTGVEIDLFSNCHRVIASAAVSASARVRVGDREVGMRRSEEEKQGSVPSLIVLSLRISYHFDAVRVPTP